MGILLLAIIGSHIVLAVVGAWPSTRNGVAAVGDNFFDDAGNIPTSVKVLGDPNITPAPDDYSRNARGACYL